MPTPSNRLRAMTWRGWKRRKCCLSTRWSCCGQQSARKGRLWFSWNPRFRTDAVDKFLRKNPPREAVVAQINWNDNPWFPEVLRKEMLHDYETDPELAEH